MAISEGKRGLAHGSVTDLLALVTDMALPTLSKGVLRRRPRVVGLLENTGTEARGIRRLQALRQKYAGQAVLLSAFGRKHLILTDPAQVQYVLQQTPALFQSSSDEKTSALAHFEPGVSLVSDGTERQTRRNFNAEVLDEGCPMHSLSGPFRQVVRHEFGGLLSALQRGDDTHLSWEHFEAAWNRVIRCILLGTPARDDDALTAMLNKLRETGNWAFLHPGRKRLRRKFHDALQTHLDHADPSSLAGLAAQSPAQSKARPSDQFTHYMFAFDPGGMATFRALALLAAHPETLQVVRARLASGEDHADPLLRATLLESLRLWSTTPVILRQARIDIDWRGDTLPAKTQVVIYAPFFHRDDETLTEAHSFAPGLWPEGRVLRDTRFVPFSDGDGICPARDLVLMTGAMVLAELLGTHTAALQDPKRLDASRPLPPTLDNYTLAFHLTAA
ncbi:cytochrome P450 [Roseinatronobacter sp. S2]|uniref:cytochrome P450 n=1 Tax=Roseinatronobacter sp. S2 TaxID=3035471 RepID=UPI00240EA67D|nr:cytochrome P450 [Roseinatronobacter sp. S2]WFE76558.1 cytochrome P450 [Roseinatronobacter sp. S2]